VSISVPFDKVVAFVTAQEPLSNYQSFRAEARYQRVCAACDSAGTFQPHHVVYEQELVRRRLPRYDTRNALRLCGPGAKNRCHERHHGPNYKIPTAKLTDSNVIYAFMVLGPYAADWLRRYYDDRMRDPRIRQLESMDVQL
jgi:hypothetical protein